MRVLLIDFKTGWYEVQIELTRGDITKLIRSLTNLQQSVPSAHFHCSSDFKGGGGIAEVELSLVPDDSKGSFTILELQQPEIKLPE